jgi:hypothetical protein
MDDRIGHGSSRPRSPSRRRLLAASASIGTLALTPDALWAAVRAGAADERGAPTERALLDAVCNLVIPETDTPGAQQALVPEFVLLAVAHRLAGAEPGAVERLAVELDRLAGRAFTACDLDRQLAVIQALDDEAFSESRRARSSRAAATLGMAPDWDLADWRALKALIVIGYYTSEPGATKELRYEFVPGRYDADIPFHPGDRALMNDWWGNTF